MLHFSVPLLESTIKLSVLKQQIKEQHTRRMACPQKFKKLTLFHRYAKEDEKWERKKKDRQEKSAEK